ncbi:MAG: GAF domain-containing protein [Anaerolineales bacterium]|nr:GAF domain-containing protein [Anaerolineales bacterium]
MRPQTRITATQLGTIRLVISAVVLLAAALFLVPQWETVQVKVVLVSLFAILASSIASLLLIRAGREDPGLGFTIYGFMLGLFTISVVVERIGLFVGVFIIFSTVLIITTGINPRRTIVALASSVVFGAGALLLDLYTRGAAYRLPISDQLESVFGFITFGVIAIFLVMLIRQYAYLTLRVKLLSAFLVGGLIALSAMGYFNNQAVKNTLTEEANASLFNAAAQTENSLRQFIEFNLQGVETEANLPTFVNFLSLPDNEKNKQIAMVNDTLVTLAARDTDFLAGYALLDLNGKVWMDTESVNTSANQSDTFAFTEPISKGRAVMSPVIFDPADNAPYIYFSSPVIENGTTILGVLRVRFRAEKLQQLIESNNDLGGTGSFAVLFDENLLHLAHGIQPETFFTTVAPPEEFAREELDSQDRLPYNFGESNFLELGELAENLAASLEDSNGVIFFDATDIATGDLQNRVVALNMGEPNWILTFFQPEEIFLAPNREIQRNTVTLGLLSLAGTVLVALVLTQVLIRPIVSLTEKANALAQGDFETRVEITTNDEIGALGQSFNSMSYQLQNMVNSLESQVAVRTKQLENRAAQLQACAEVARDATSEQEMQDVLTRAATLIHDRFGYYHVGIYMKDSQGEFAVLTATTDEPGLRILELGHQFSLDEHSHVGKACLTSEPVIANADETTAQLNFNPMLPGSQAQLVLPLNLGKQTIGAIDLHSTNPTAFSNREDQIFMTLADQLAIAIEKANVQEEIQKTLTELETVYRDFSQRSWQQFIQSRRNISGYRINRRNLIEEVETPSGEVQKVWESGEKIYQRTEKDNQNSTTIAIPIKSRGSVISVLNIELEGDRVPLDTANLIDEISDRLSLILENARLIETARRQVEREQMTNEIANRMRQSLDMDVVLRTAVQEFGQKLGLTEVELRLGSYQKPTTESIPGPNGNKANEETA